MTALTIEQRIEHLQRCILFKHLGPRAMRSLAQTVRPISIQRGEHVIRQGERGDALYLIVEGTVRVTITPAAAEASSDAAPFDIPVARLTPGAHFGEQALLHEQPALRSANVQAIDHCQLLEIPADAFREIIQFDEGLRRLLEDEGREYVLNNLQDTTRALQSVEVRLGRLGRDRRTYGDRQVLFRQGQPAQGAYLLTAGTVRIKFLDSMQRVESAVELVAPRLLGERGVLHQAARSGTAVAVGDVEVVFIPADELRALHESSPALAELCQALENVYDVQGVGRVTHYEGTLLSMPAHCLLIEHDDGREFITYKVIDSDIFSITAAELREPQTLWYESGDRVRQLVVDGDTLVGLTSYGYWPDSHEVTAAVIAGVTLHEADRAVFGREGRIPGALSQLAEASPELVCRCMQVYAGTIDALISSGVSTLPVIMNRCGAGTVCGGCRPRINQMLGHQAWSPQTLQPPVRHTEGIWSFRFSPVEGTVESFQPGQHIVVRAPINGEWIERSYTLTSTPDDPYYEITVKREPGGLFSNWLFENAERGPTFQASSPQGEFVVDPDAGSAILLFAGGIGVTPSIGFLRSMCLAGEESSAREVPVVVDYSARTAEDFIAQDVFDHAAQQLPRFRFRRRVTSVDGRITQQGLVRLLREYKDPRVYICGPKAFETSVVSMLEDCGMPASSIMVEEFASVAPSGRTEGR